MNAWWAGEPKQSQGGDVESKEIEKKVEKFSV